MKEPNTASKLDTCSRHNICAIKVLWINSNLGNSLRKEYDVERWKMGE